MNFAYIYSKMTWKSYYLPLKGAHFAQYFKLTYGVRWKSYNSDWTTDWLIAFQQMLTDSESLNWEFANKNWLPDTDNFYNVVDFQFVYFKSSNNLEDHRAWRASSGLSG